MNFDLKIERTLDIPVELAWKAWTTPELICQWFCPKPWKVVDCEIDLKPGGIFKTVMESPEGEKHPNIGCFLEIIPFKKIVWTDVLLPGFQPADLPASGAGLAITCIITFEEINGVTLYTGIARHKNAEDKKRHEEMGFQEGWGICADQLVELMKANS